MATFGVILPSFIVILLIANLLLCSGKIFTSRAPWEVLKQLRPGLVLIAVWQVGRTAVSDVFSALCAISAFLLIAVFDINVVYVIILFLLIGVAKEFLFPGKPALDPAAINADEKEGTKKDKE